MNIRIVLVVAILILDIFIVPSLLTFPLFIKEYGPKAANQWINQISIWGSFKELFSGSKFGLMWLWVQPLFAAIIIKMFWQDVPRKKNRVNDGVGGPESAGGGQYGTSRWQTDKEIDKNSDVWYSHKPLKKGGIVLGMEPYKTLNTKTLKVWLDAQDTHTLVIGTTRSGKTRTQILPTIWTLAHSGESMVLTDPKGELYDKTNKYLKEKGYDVVLIDFRDPGRGNRWNPMQPVVQAIQNGNLAFASESAWDISHTIVYQRPHNGDPIWANGQESTLAALILGVAMEAPDEDQKHMASVYHFLAEMGETIQTPQGEVVPLNEYFASLPPGHLAKAAFGTARLAPGKTRGSFFAGVSADLRLFADPSIAYLTATQDHDLSDVGKKPTAVFLVIPDEKSTRHVLASLYIDQTYQALVSLANHNRGRLPNRVHFLLDEFGNMPPIADFDKKITVSAGRGIRFTLIVQDFQQIKKAYKDSAQTVMGNCHTWIYLLTTDPDTASLISKKTGQYTVETESFSSSVRTRDTSHSFSNSLASRYLLMPDEVLRWPYGNALLLRARQFPARLALPDISNWPNPFDDISYFEEKRQIQSVNIWQPLGTSNVAVLDDQVEESSNYIILNEIN